MRAQSVVLTLLLGLTGCAGSGGGDAAEDDRGGMGVPQQLAGEDYPGPREALAVRVRLADNGCFLGATAQEHEPRLVVWPSGTELGEHGDELRLPDGTLVRDGAELEGPGLLLPADQLPGTQDGYWAYAVGFCTPDADTVLVLDRARPRA